MTEAGPSHDDSENTKKEITLEILLRRDNDPPSNLHKPVANQVRDMDSSTKMCCVSILLLLENENQQLM